MAITASFGNTKTYVRPAFVTSPFYLFCAFEQEEIVDFGTNTTNKEYCGVDNDPILTIGDLEFSNQTFSYMWTEANGSDADKVFKNAFESNTMNEKTVTIKMVAKDGSYYWADFIVTDYKFIFKKGEVSKTSVTVEQVDTPTNRRANTQTADSTKITADSTKITADAT